jgi:Flp pilus assembly protein TadD
MGRTRTKTKKPVPVISSPHESPTKSAPSIPSLLSKAQELIVQCDYDLARMFVKRVLDYEPVHAEAREMMGVVLLETGEIDEARSVSD